MSDLNIQITQIIYIELEELEDSEQTVSHSAYGAMKSTKKFSSLSKSIMALPSHQLKQFLSSKKSWITLEENEWNKLEKLKIEINKID